MVVLIKVNVIMYKIVMGFGQDKLLFCIYWVNIFIGIIVIIIIKVILVI